MLCSAPRREIPMARERGRSAYVSGRPVTDCPYAMGSISSIDWITAWVQEEEEAEESIHALIQQRGRMGK